MDKLTTFIIFSSYTFSKKTENFHVIIFYPCLERDV